jgi:carbon storage regulator
MLTQCAKEAITGRRRWIMLILTRRPTQSLTIGGNITVTVLEIRGSQVRIGVDAPPDIDIRRDEIVGKARGAPRRPDAGS